MESFALSLFNINFKMNQLICIEYSWMYRCCCWLRWDYFFLDLYLHFVHYKKITFFPTSQKTNACLFLPIIENSNIYFLPDKNFRIYFLFLLISFSKISKLIVALLVQISIKILTLLLHSWYYNVLWKLNHLS